MENQNRPCMQRTTKRSRRIDMYESDDDEPDGTENQDCPLTENQRKDIFLAEVAKLTSKKELKEATRDFFQSYVVSRERRETLFKKWLICLQTMSVRLWEIC